MRWILSAAAAALLCVCGTDAKAVFAHFMVSNAQNYTLSDWADEIQLAQAAHIDAFALNTAYDQGDGPQYKLAFQAAGSAGFKLFFSFDYAGNGAWPKDEVISILQSYGSNAAHYQYNEKPFVSTFEGPERASDWPSIKKSVNCFFVPDWSSLGAKPALELENGVADGLFAWSAWPWGNQDMDTFVDASYLQYLNGTPYMMPVSPLFYTNLPGYNKNWLWRGDSLWADRWTQINYLQPEWVQIISWNDYGESHYIGPIRQKALGAMRTGRAPFDYVSNMPHDGFRELLPFAADLYKHNTTTISQEKLVFWHRQSPAAATSDGGTTGNTASQLQYEFPPAQVVNDRVFFSAILNGHADVSVSIGGAAVAASWTDVPDGNVGHFHGSVDFGGRTGPVVVSLARSGQSIMSGTGQTIGSSGQNWNMWVGSASGSATSGTPTSLGDQVCVNGTSVTAFQGLCSFSCSLGYCPVGACQCTAMGKQPTLPKELNIKGYPAAGLDENYSGLCAFACNYGYCPTGVCGTTPQPLTTPTVSPFLPDACTAGTGSGAFEGLCKFSCNFGYCPIHICTCTGRGPLNEPPAVDVTIQGKAVGGDADAGLCSFACSRGYCPPGSCEQGVNIQALEQAFKDGLELSGYDTSNFESYNLTELATTLVGFEECTKQNGMPHDAIYSGWQQSWKLMNLMYKEANNGIDFNSAAALEFLGPPGQTVDYQSSFNEIFKNLATIQPGYFVPGFFSWRLHVRCDDPGLKCPCNGNPANQPYAYTLSSGPGNNGLAYINFCPKYFRETKLDDAMKMADRTNFPFSWMDMNNYKWTQGGTWFHELLHIDWVSKSGSYGNNAEITDIVMEIRRREGKQTIVNWLKAYEPLGTKMLARYEITTGYWTIRNAESFLMLALARYVQDKVGLYPHLPLAPEPPYKIVGEDATTPYFSVPGLFEMFGDGTIQVDDSTAAYDHLSWDPTDTCAILDDNAVNDDSNVVTMSAAFAPQAAYPTAYMSSWSSWAGLTAPAPTPTTPPATPPTPSPYYDCQGDTLCSTTNVKFCDKAVNNMERGSKIYTSGDNLASAGNCWANAQGFGCSVKIRGTDNDGKACKITGDDMWYAYQDIRNDGDCSKCGSKHFGNGCLVSIDYYYGCDNRDPGPNRIMGGLGNDTVDSTTLDSGTLDSSTLEGRSSDFGY